MAAMPDIARRNRQNQRRYGGGGFATKQLDVSDFDALPKPVNSIVREWTCRVHRGTSRFTDRRLVILLRCRDLVDEFYFESRSTLFTGKSQWASRTSNRRCSSFWNVS